MTDKPSPNRTSLPVGVFDSGLGGLTIVRAIRRRLPREQVLYFGDMARLPYGTKSRAQIRKYSLQNSDFLLKRGIKALVIACNSSSSAAYMLLKRRLNIPVVDVIGPAVDAAIEKTRTGRIGVIGTHATIESGSYERELLKRDAALRVFSRPCPLFVPYVEEGMIQGALCRDTIAYYLSTLRKKKIDTLILGCTHYPLLKREIEKYMTGSVALIDSAEPCTRRLEKVLDGNGIASRRGRSKSLKVYVSDQPRNFIRVGERFLGERLGTVRVIRKF